MYSMHYMTYISPVPMHTNHTVTIKNCPTPDDKSQDGLHNVRNGSALPSLPKTP